jgi:hypothetical protein
MRGRLLDCCQWRGESPRALGDCSKEREVEEKRYSKLRQGERPALPTFDDLTDWDYWGEHMEDSLADYVQAMANPEMLLGFAELMSPATEIHEGRVFLAGHFSEETFEKWKKTATYRHGGLAAVQAVMNHVHMSDFFYRLAERVSIDNFVYVAGALGAAWKGSLEEAYPDRQFVLKIDGDEVWISEP